MNEIKNYFQAAVVADALSLGSHWVYNQSKIARLYPDGIKAFTDPASSYHPGKSAGDLTHYGQQVVILAESIEKRGGFQVDGWREDWLASMKNFSGYMDGASRETIASNGISASPSNDLAGASRLAPILDLPIPLNEKISAARAQAALTHGDADVIDSTEFIVRAVGAIEGGADFSSAFDRAAEEGNYQSLNAKEALAIARSQTGDFLAVGASLGLTCHFPEAFPLTLYLALREGADFSSAISENGLAGGDTSARAIALAVLFAARDGAVGQDLMAGVNLSYTLQEASAPTEYVAGSNPVSLTYDGKVLAGVLEMPEGEVQATAIFAHCFTCGKDFLPGARVSRGLASRGIATLRIDFSGLGKSGGKFEDSSFITNLDDLVYAAKWLSEALSAPSLLVGHSLGGAAVLAAAARIDTIKAVSTIGAPADPGHVTHMFEDDLEKIQQEGKAEVQLAGRAFVIGERFISDIANYDQKAVLAGLRGIDVLVMHAPDDDVVGIANAGQIYSALNHPKSFISLAGADHLLTKPEDAEYVADLIRVWARRVLG